MPGTPIEAGGTSLKDRVGGIAAAVAVAGGVWFVVVALLSAWVYEPVRVSPRDLGLSSSSIVVQATIGLLVCGFVGLVVGSAVGGIWGAWQGSRDEELRLLGDQMPLPFTSDDPASKRAAAALLRRHAPELSQEQAEQSVNAVHDAVSADRLSELRASMPAGVSEETLADLVRAMDRELPRRLLRLQILWTSTVVGAATGFVVALLVSLAVVVAVASNSRDAIQAGRAPGFVLGLPAPWSATVVAVGPVGNSGADMKLPSCALFLGEANSTVFLRDHSQRTIRIPSSTVRLDLSDQHRCS